MTFFRTSTDRSLFASIAKWMGWYGTVTWKSRETPAGVLPSWLNKSLNLSHAMFVRMAPELSNNSRRRNRTTSSITFTSGTHRSLSIASAGNSPSEPSVYTAGYEQMSVDAFLNRLIDNGIQRIIDVRNNPIARRYGFHKSTLSRLAGYLDIDYVHIPELGIASSRRRSLTTHADYQELFDEYEQDTVRVQTEAVDRAAALVKEKASVLVCMEADPVCCHRSRLANAVAELTGLEIHDLGHCKA